MLRALCILSIVMMAGAGPAAAQTQPSTAPAAFVRPEAPAG